MSLSYIFCHYYNILIMLSSRSISQNFLWLRETLLSESFPVTCRLRRSTLSYNSSVPALLGGVWGRGLNDCICAALHSSTLAWNIPWTEVPGRLQSLESQRVGCDWATLLSLFTFTHWRRKWQPTPLFVPGESQGRGSLVGCRLWGCTESDMTEAT